MKSTTLIYNSFVLFHNPLMREQSLYSYTIFQFPAINLWIVNTDDIVSWSTIHEPQHLFIEIIIDVCSHWAVGQNFIFPDCPRKSMLAPFTSTTWFPTALARGTNEIKRKLYICIIIWYLLKQKFPNFRRKKRKNKFWWKDLKFLQNIFNNYNESLKSVVKFCRCVLTCFVLLWRCLWCYSGIWILKKVEFYQIVFSM